MICMLISKMSVKFNASWKDMLYITFSKIASHLDIITFMREARSRATTQNTLG